MTLLISKSCLVHGYVGHFQNKVLRNVSCCLCRMGEFLARRVRMYSYPPHRQFLLHTTLFSSSRKQQESSLHATHDQPPQRSVSAFLAANFEAEAFGMNDGEFQLTKHDLSSKEHGKYSVCSTIGIYGVWILHSIP